MVASSKGSGAVRLAIVDGLDIADSRVRNVRPRYNAAPSQELLVIRENHKTGECSLDLLKCPLLVPRREGWPETHQRQSRECLQAPLIHEGLRPAALHRTC